MRALPKDPARQIHYVDNYGVSKYLDAFITGVWFESVRTPDACPQQIMYMIAGAWRSNFHEMRKRSSKKVIKEFLRKSKEFMTDIEDEINNPKWLLDDPFENDFY